MQYCTECGEKVSSTKYCTNCGVRVEGGHKIAKKTTTIRENKASAINEALFYSEDWVRKKHFALSSLPNLDILVTKDSFYLIKFPKMHGSLVGLILGLLILNLLGAIIGTVIGNSSDKKKRKRLRTAWVNSNQELISDKYQNSIFLEIPKRELSTRLSFKKDKLITITHGDKLIVLKNNKEERSRFSEFIKTYVL